MLKNEEEIRGKVLLPYLQELGFDLSEISLEKSFTIRLGKTQHTIKHTINGRSDILCKRNGKNLFIIEVKNDSVSITENDIAQGISYARALIDDIAPFTIITNLKITKIFDSVSRIELTGKKISEESSFWKNDYTLSSDEELKIRYEALKNFVSFSSENLALFCKNQVKDRMGPIIGSIDDSSAKFIKELHFQRKDLQLIFNKFINSDAKVFGIVGSAGVGKTSAMCALALQNLEDKFVFFYNAAIINRSPFEHISQDLNLVFSNRSNSDVILKKLDEFGRLLNKNVLIFIDAIDESVDKNISLELSEIALACRNLDKVKFCVSCKSTIWKDILIKNDTPTHLFEELLKFHELISDLGNSPGFLLEDFSDEELNSIIPLYKSVFGFKGQISESLSKELRNGFFLKIFSEVYSNKQIPEKINDKDLIKKYIKLSLDKTSLNFHAGLRILSQIGKVLINHKFSSWESFKDEGLEVESLLDKLNLSIDNTLPEDLFVRNILIKSNKEDSYNVTFYYSKIRDYIICFHTYRLEQLSDNDFYNVLNEFYQNYIGQSAISFYIENASVNHKNTWIKFKKDKALEYVLGYDSYLNKNFKNFKKLFNPYTEGKIGILIPQNLLIEDGYALFPLATDSSNIVQQDNFKKINSSSNNWEYLLQKGIEIVYGSHIDLLVPNQREVIKKNIFKQLKKIIEKGQIITYNSDVLLFELVSTIFYYYYPKLDYDFKIDDFYLPRFTFLYPLNLKELRDRLYRFRALDYYRRNNTHNNDDIKKLVEIAFNKNIDIPKMNTTGDFPPFEELFKIVNILLEKGYSEIQKHHLPPPDKSITETKAYYDKNRGQDLSKIRDYQYSEEQSKLYIDRFFRHLESSYKDFVEYCFPTYKDEFTFYKSIPNEYIFYMKDSDVFKWGYFGYRPLKCEKDKIKFKEFSASDKAFEEDKIPVLRAFNFDMILHSGYDNQIKTIYKINTSKVDDFCVIRKWIYKLLQDDMRKLFNENTK